MTAFERISESLRSSPKTWLVTGVAGFIGSNLLDTLLDLGQNVVGLDNFSSGYRRNLHEVLKTSRRRRDFKLIEGDICNLGTCIDACRDVDYVLHEAAIGSVPRSLQDPIAANEVNISGFMNMMVAARDAEVQRFVYASSSAVYGDATAMPSSEDQVGNPLSPYAVQKFTNEKYAEVFSKVSNIQTVGLRYFNVFGPRQDPLGSYAAVIPQWINAILLGETCYIHGDGQTTRDFCSVHDVVQANILAATTKLPRSAYRVFNVGAGCRTSLNELHQMLAEGVSMQRPDYSVAGPVHDDFRDGDVRHSQANIAQIRADLHYEPVSDLSRALEDTVKWYLTRLNVRTQVAQSA